MISFWPEEKFLVQFFKIMHIFTKTIFTGFAPNSTSRDIKSAIQFLLLPWYWRRWVGGTVPYRVEEWLKFFFNIPIASVFDSGRSALYILLQALNIQPDDEIILPAYTCAVVVNAVKWINAKPIFVDIDDGLNINPIDLEKKINVKTKAVIIQHTFGRPANLSIILPICDKNKIKVIEDCAHSLGVKINNQLLGTFGVAAIFSFGSEKVVSCARGGAIITRDVDLGKKIVEIQSALPPLNKLKIFQHLTCYPIFWLGKITYHLVVGKLLLFVSGKINLIAKIIYPPVDTHRFSINKEIGDYFLAGGRLVPYKRFDLLVQVFNRLKKMKLKKIFLPFFQKLHKSIGLKTKK